MEGSVPNLLVLPDTGGLHQCGDLSIDDYFFQVLSSFIQTPSVSEAPHREGYHGFPHWFLLVSILPRVAVLLDIHFPHLLFHAFSLGGIGIDKVLLLPPPRALVLFLPDRQHTLQYMWGFGLWTRTTLISPLLSEISRQLATYISIFRCL